MKKQSQIFIKRRVSCLHDWLSSFLATGWDPVILINTTLTLRSVSVQFTSVTQLCLTLCNPLDWSMPGLPVHHQLLEFSQTHVHRASDVTQSSHPLASPSPPTFNLSQHQGLFQ